MAFFRRLLAFFILCSLFSSGFPLAAESVPQLEVPSNVKIEKSNDVTSHMLARLFGESWQDVTGVGVDSGNFPYAAQTSFGLYSGLIVKILGILNLAALAFVATSILYMWGIMAVTTAYEGQKIGGNAFNSLWVPVRHAFSFSLTIPVLNGLSLLQVLIIACIGISINFANVIWDAGGGYIASRMKMNVMEVSSPMLESEAFRALPYMFSDAVIQEIEMRKSKDWSAPFKPETWSPEWWKEIFGLNGKPTAMDENAWAIAHGYNPAAEEKITLEEAGPNNLYIVRTDCKTGTRDIYLKNPTSLHPDDMAKVSLAYPVSLDTESGQTMAKIADIRTKHVIELWEGMRRLARAYLASRECGSGDDNCVIADKGCADRVNFEKSGLSVEELTRKYRDGVRSDIKPLIAQLVQKTNIAEKMRNAVDSEKSQSKYGWISAGLMSFTLATIQKDIDDQILTRIGFSGRPGAATDRIVNNSWNHGDDYANSTYSKSSRFDSTELSAIRKAGTFLANKAMSTSRYASVAYAQNENESKGDDLFSELMVKFGAMVIFPEGKSGSNTRIGLLGQALDAFANYDPIVVIASFGNQLLNIGTGMLVGSTVLAFFVKNMLFIGVIALLLVTGCIFAFAVPITPVIFWLRAVMSWIFMVIEAMVAAPFWACTHALPEGHGFAGNHARRGYMMLLDIVARPALLVTGAILALAVIQALGKLFSLLFNSWFSVVGSYFISIGVFADITFTIIFMSFMYYMSFTIFTKGVNYLPEHVMSWCGGQAGGMRDEESATRNIIVAGGSFNTLSQQMQGGGQILGKGLGKLGSRAGKPDAGKGSDKPGASAPQIAAGEEKSA